jgi:hypothetical protein
MSQYITAALAPHGAMNGLAHLSAELLKGPRLRREQELQANREDNRMRLALTRQNLLQQKVASDAAKTQAAPALNMDMWRISKDIAETVEGDPRAVYNEQASAFGLKPLHVPPEPEPEYKPPFFDPKRSWTEWWNGVPAGSTQQQAAPAPALTAEETGATLQQEDESVAAPELTIENMRDPRRAALSPDEIEIDNKFGNGSLKNRLKAPASQIFPDTSRGEQYSGRQPTLDEMEVVGQLSPEEANAFRLALDQAEPDMQRAILNQWRVRAGIPTDVQRKLRGAGGIGSATRRRGYWQRYK